MFKVLYVAYLGYICIALWNVVDYNMYILHSILSTLSNVFGGG